MTNISPTIQTLLERMDKFPGEFFDERHDTTDGEARFSLDGTKWEGISRTIAFQASGKLGIPVFTPEEVDAYTRKLASIIRKQIEEDVCAKLVKFEQTDDPRQLELPFGHAPIKSEGQWIKY